MIAPRLEIDLDKIHHNASALVTRLADRGISVTGVTKASLGSPEIASALLRAGVKTLGDSRIENLEGMRRAGVSAPMALLRTPMLSQVVKVVAHADVSFNTELDVIHQLSLAAQQAGRNHGIVLMVELGDLREGILPKDLLRTARGVLRFPNVTLRGVGVNLACRSGVSPDAGNMAELTSLAEAIEAALDVELDIVSGGNSANLNWAWNSQDFGRVNDLRLGESILLGREALHREPIDGLYTDAIKLVAEVIESKTKPSLPRGKIAQTAFGKEITAIDRGDICQTILAIGRQDTDPLGLLPPPGITVLEASSDHLITDSGSCRLAIGTEIPFQLNYSALLRAMTSPFVTKIMVAQSKAAALGDAVPIPLLLSATPQPIALKPVAHQPVAHQPAEKLSLAANEPLTVPPR